MFVIVLFDLDNNVVCEFSTYNTKFEAKNNIERIAKTLCVSESRLGIQELSL